MTISRAAQAVAAALALALAAVAPRELAAQRPSRIPVQAGATLERDSVTVGDVVRLMVRVHAPLGATINFPAAVDSLGPVQSLEPPAVRSGSDSLDAADRIATYRLAAWDVGTLPIRLGDVVVQTDDDERRVLLTLPSITIRTVLPADTAQRTPKPARPLLPVRSPIPWWWWVAAAAAALMIGFGAWWWRRRRAGAGGLPGDPFGDAEHEFDRIERMRLVDAGESGRHAALMADVMRRYVAARVEPASLAQTSVELVRALRGTAGMQLDRVERLLERVDLIKFGAARVTPADARALGADARAIVRAEHEHAVAVAAAAAAAGREGVAA